MEIYKKGGVHMFDILIYYEGGQSDTFSDVTKVLNSNNEVIDLKNEGLSTDLETITIFAEDMTSSLNLKKLNVLQTIIRPASSTNIEEIF